MVTIKCVNCGNEYQLKKGKIPSDLQCECGGKLKVNIVPKNYHTNTDHNQTKTQKSYKTNLKPCKTCGREISTNARKCPHCGERNPTTPYFKDMNTGEKGVEVIVTIVVIIIAIIIPIFILLLC